MWKKTKTWFQNIIVSINDDIIFEWWNLEQDIQHEGKGDYCSKRLSIMSTQKSNRSNWSKFYQNFPPNNKTTQKVHELNDLIPSSTNTSIFLKLHHQGKF